MKARLTLDLATGAQIILSTVALLLCGMAAGDYVVANSYPICLWPQGGSSPPVSEACR